MNMRSLLRRPSFVIAALILVAVGVVWGVSAARANQPKTLDQRLYDVTSQIQCPACNGESVADSSSQVAADMRSVAREKLAAGQSEAQVVQYFRDHYGDTILESPPKQGFTLLIWWAPVLMLLAGLAVLWSIGREWRARAVMERPAGIGDATPVFSNQERDALRALLQRELDAEEGLTGTNMTTHREEVR